MESVDEIERRIDAALAGPEPDFEADPEPPVDADIANRWLYRLGKTQAALDRLTERRAEEIAKIEAVFDGPISTAAGQVMWLTDALKAWHKAQRALDPTRATFTFPNGTLRSQRPQTPKLKVDNEAAFVEWAERCAPGLLRETTVSKPDRDAMKTRLVMTDGKVLLGDEIVPGLSADSETTFTVKATR